MLTLTIQAGLRVSELIALNTGDIQLGTGAHVRCEGKGRKQRTVPLTTPAQAVLTGWLTERGGRPTDPLFVTRTGRRLSRDAIEQRVTVHATTATASCPSLASKQLHPHVLRHSCAMSLLQAGVDTTVIALWFGHARCPLDPALPPRRPHDQGESPRARHPGRRQTRPLQARRRDPRVPREPVNYADKPAGAIAEKPSAAHGVQTGRGDDVGIVAVSAQVDLSSP